MVLVVSFLVSFRCSQLAYPHLGKIVPAFKEAYLAPSINSKNVASAKKISVHVVLLCCGDFGVKILYLASNFGQNGHRISHFQSHFQKQKSCIYFQKVAFIDNFERKFEKLQSGAELWPFF